jgi:hypothetical protein
MVMAILSGEWLTISEASHELRLSTGRIRQLILEGRLAAREVNARLKVIAREELERFKAIERPTGQPGHSKKS